MSTYIYMHIHNAYVYTSYTCIYINMYAFMCMFDGTGLRPCTDICVAYMHISHLNAEDIHAPHYRDLFICISSATATCDTAERLQNAQSHGSSNCQGWVHIRNMFIQVHAPRDVAQGLVWHSAQRERERKLLLQLTLFLLRWVFCLGLALRSWLAQVGPGKHSQCHSLRRHSKDCNAALHNVPYRSYCILYV